MNPKPGERCNWTGISDPLYARYHDEEWGVPLTDSHAMFEKLVLEGFQSGLSWLTILKKRENFRSAFDHFDTEKIARYRTRDIERLMHDAGIVRNLAKIEATIENAKAYNALSKTKPFAHFIWSFLDAAPIQNQLKSLKDAPPETELSKRISKALKREGFRFVGPTTVYAFMQSSGMVNDHLITCPRHATCAQLQAALKVPGR